MRNKGESPVDFGFEGVSSSKQSSDDRPKAQEATFVQRTYKLVPLTELESDAYGPGGPMSGKPMPKFKEVLVGERQFTGIG